MSKKLIMMKQRVNELKGMDKFCPRIHVVLNVAIPDGSSQQKVAIYLPHFLHEVAYKSFSKFTNWEK